MTPRILFVHNHLARFVQIDRDLLRERWSVHEWYEYSRRVNLSALARAVHRSDLVFGWFASWHTFWPFALGRLMGKPTVLITGGYDVANRPDIGYGHQRGGPKKWLSRWIICHATAVSTFSVFSQREINCNLGLPLERIRVIYLGLPDTPGSLTELPRERAAITVGNVDRSNLVRKGQADFVRSAAYLPDATFALIGEWRDDAIQYLRSIASRNVTFTGRLSDAALEDYYQRAAVYVQLSRHEGFGLAVAEAMLAGCIPVVSRVGALPEVVGECGIYVEDQSPSAVAEGITLALQSMQPVRDAARVRILDNFSIAERRKKLYMLVETVLTGCGVSDDPALLASAKR